MSGFRAAKIRGGMEFQNFAKVGIEEGGAACLNRATETS